MIFYLYFKVMNPELVLVVGDMFIPQRSPDITDQFKSILTPNKVQHVLCLGNIGNNIVAFI